MFIRTPKQLSIYIFVFCIFFIYSKSGVTEPDSNHPHQLSDVIISAPLTHSVSETATPVSVLIGDDLRKKTQATIGATLQEEPGINNQSFGPGVGQPVIRGQTGSRVKVLQNALGSLDVSGLSPDHANSTEAIWADRIEIVRGPATLLYGSGAIGGVVNVIDNRIPDHIPNSLLSGAFEQRYDTVNEGTNTALKLEGGVEQFAWHLDGFYRQSNNLHIPGYAIDTSLEAEAHDADDHEQDVFNSYGRLLNTDTEAYGGTAGVSWVSDFGFAGFAINHIDNNYGIPPGAHSHEEDLEEHEDNPPDQHAHAITHGHDDDDDHEAVENASAGEEDFEKVRIAMRQTRYDFKTVLDNPFEYTESFKIQLGYNDYQHIESENGVSGTVFKNKGLTSRMEIVQTPWLWFDHGVTGMQTENSEFSAIGEEAVVPKSDIDRYGFFSVQDIHTANLTYELGLRVEQQYITPDNQPGSSHTPVSGSASALWYFSENEDNISLSFSRSQRAPDVQELYAEGAHLATSSYLVGNPFLSNESAHNLELGMHFTRDWMQMDFSVYHNWVNDYIAQMNSGLFYDDHDGNFVADCHEGGCLPVYFAEQRDAEFTGYEAQLDFRLYQNRYGDFHTELFSDFVRGRFTHGGDIPRMPPLRYGMQLSWVNPAWSANIRITRAEEQDHPGENETVTNGYWLLNIGADYLLKLDDKRNLLLFLKANNLLDQEIRNSTSFIRNIAPEGGRGVQLGLRIGF